MASGQHADKGTVDKDQDLDVDKVETVKGSFSFDLLEVNIVLFPCESLLSAFVVAVRILDRYKRQYRGIDLPRQRIFTF